MATSMAKAPPVAFSGNARFAVIRRLGQGGMGTVYEVLDRERRTRVALKTLSTLNADTLLLFKNEFRALQDIQHPNLVRLGELFEEDGHWFFTMELVVGVDFMTYVNPEHDPLAEASTDRDGTPLRSRRSADTLRSPPTSAPADASQEVPGEARPDQTADAGQGAFGEETDDTGQTSDLPSTREIEDATVSDPLGDKPEVSQRALPRPGHFDELRLRRALGQLAQGVYALHAAQKIHRDLKPSSGAPDTDRGGGLPRRGGAAAGPVAARARVCGTLSA